MKVLQKVLSGYLPSRMKARRQLSRLHGYPGATVVSVVAAEVLVAEVVVPVVLVIGGCCGATWKFNVTSNAFPVNGIFTLEAGKVAQLCVYATGGFSNGAKLKGFCTRVTLELMVAREYSRMMDIELRHGEVGMSSAYAQLLAHPTATRSYSGRPLNVAAA